MSYARSVLIAAGLGFGLWETVDVFRIDVPAAAAVVATLFLSCTAWFWRRGSVRANVALLLLFVLEAGEAPTWKHASTATKAGSGALALLGIAAALAKLASTRRAKSSRVPAAG